MPGKHSQAHLESLTCLQTHLYILLLTVQGLLERIVCVFKLDQQGRLVHVRMVVVAQVAQRNEYLIACSVLLPVISFSIVLTIQPCHKKPP